MARPAAGLLKDLRPDIFAQLLHPEDGLELSVGSNSKVEWICEKGHVWEAQVYNRTNAKNSTGCPVCDGKRVLKGFNDLDTTDPDVADLLANQSMRYSLMRNTNKKVRWRCEQGHEWNAPVSRLTSQGSRCPYCSGRYPIPGKTDLATTHPDIAAQLVDQSLATKIKAGTSKRLMWRCPKGHVWEATAHDRTYKQNGCPYCSGRNAIVSETDFATTQPELTKELVDPSLATTFKENSDIKVEWRCVKHPEHTWFATPGNRVNKHSGCPICDNKQIVPGFNDVATTHPYVADWMVDPDLATKVPAGSAQKVQLQCRVDPLHVWEESLYHLTNGEPIACPLCAGVHRSKSECELEQVIRELVSDEDVVVSNKSICGERGYEIDIVVPARGIAIEFNGVRWHSEEYQTRNDIHLWKTERCRTAGYQLIHVWDDDWRDRKSVVIRMLAAKLGATDRLPHVSSCGFDNRSFERVGARTCSVEILDGQDARRFLDENHIQGAVTATYHFALVDADGFIRAVLSVRSPRNNARMKRAPGEWEVQRYATCGIVPGGCSKLMKFAEAYIAEQGLEITSWVSFSANDVSDGAMYERSGFEKVADIAPDYKYVGTKTRMRRKPKEGFQKRCFKKDPDLEYQEGMTELELAHLNGLYRIYDAGKQKWVKPVL